jgi:Flp pilus assembly protein CpaB
MQLALGDRLTPGLGSVRRGVLARRRGLALLLLGVAVLAGLHAVRPPDQPREQVLTAAHDLAAGAVLTRHDLTARPFAPGSVPDGVLGTEAVGRTLAGGVRRGEPITDERLAGPALSSDTTIAVPVRLPDAAMVDLLSVGDHIDLVATSPRSGQASILVYDAPVLGLPRHAASGPATTADGGSGALVVLGIAPGQVARVSGAAASRFLTFAFAR